MELQEHLNAMRSVIEQAQLGIEGMTDVSGELATSSRAIADGAVNRSRLPWSGRLYSLEQITATVRQSAEMADAAKRLAS